MVNRLSLGMALYALFVVSLTAHAGVAPDLKCKEAKAKAAGLKAASLLTAFMSNNKKPNADKLAKIVAKAQSNFTKAFTKAESKGGCVTSDDSLAIEAEVDGFVAAVINGLCPPGSTTTTTTSTTLPSTSSTISTSTSTTSTSTTSTSSTTTTTTLPSGSLVINEIDYDQVDTDDQEFVEIFNPSSGPMGLDGLALIFVNGADSKEYRRVDLSAAAVLPAGQYLVVGSPLVVVPPSATKLDLPTSGAIQNGPDGVALVSTVTEQVLDTLSYEGEIVDAAIVGFSGTVNLVEGVAFDGEDSATETGSLIRSPNGTDSDNASSDWAVTNSLTPGEANL